METRGISARDLISFGAGMLAGLAAGRLAPPVAGQAIGALETVFAKIVKRFRSLMEKRRSAQMQAQGAAADAA